jgi:hypothetical protein
LPMRFRRIYEEMWPPIKQCLDSAPPDVLKTVIETAEDWLRVGNGYDQPFGQSHPHASIDAAKEFGEKMLAELAPFTLNHPGLAALLKEVAERFDVELEVDTDNTCAIFFAEVDLVDTAKLPLKSLKTILPRLSSSGWTRTR